MRRLHACVAHAASLSDKLTSLSSAHASLQADLQASKMVCSLPTLVLFLFSVSGSNVFSLLGPFHMLPLRFRCLTYLTLHRHHLSRVTSLVAIAQQHPIAQTTATPSFFLPFS